MLIGLPKDLLLDFPKMLISGLWGAFKGLPGMLLKGLTAGVKGFIMGIPGAIAFMAVDLAGSLLIELAKAAGLITDDLQEAFVRKVFDSAMWGAIIVPAILALIPGLNIGLLGASIIGAIIGGF